MTPGATKKTRNKGQPVGMFLRLTGHDPDPHETDIGSAHAVTGAFDWMKSLPPGKYPAVDEFARAGRYTGTDALMLQMNDAANDHGPPGGGTDEIVELLLDRLGGGHPGETVQVVT